MSMHELKKFLFDPSFYATVCAVIQLLCIESSDSKKTEARRNASDALERLHNDVFKKMHSGQVMKHRFSTTPVRAPATCWSKGSPIVHADQDVRGITDAR